MKLNRVRGFLDAIADAGRDLLGRSKGGGNGGRDIGALCGDLLSQKGEVLGTALAREALAAYARLDDDGRLAFFRQLAKTYDADRAAVLAAADAYRDNPSPETLQALGHAAEPPRQEVLRRMNMAPGGTAALVAMREDLIGLLAQNPELSPVDVDFRHLLSSWFNRGFLVLRRIDWRTPAHILEKLITYEAVHEIQGWDDLRRRLAEDRRCFAFFHPALPDEPLIFVEVALVKGMAGAVQPLLEGDATADVPADADTAIFYSINNCQEGLRGISFGNFLIKQVVEELRGELPAIKTFTTLSPVPGFRDWLWRKMQAGEFAGADKDAVAGLAVAGWQRDADACARLKKPLLRLCARYLAAEKRKGLPLNAVARFHLGNGARLERINWMGDTSDNGIAQSAGILVNYLYDLGALERQHEAYANDGTVALSAKVAELAAGAD